MRTQKILLLLLFCFISTLAIGQNRMQKKANKYYKDGEFAQAIPLYETLLIEKERLSYKTKLAYCYKITNQLDKAMLLYEDVVKNEKAIASSLYHFSELLMMSGDKENAERWLNKYLKLEPDDERAILLAESIKVINTLKPFFDTVQVIPFQQNTLGDDNAPVFWKDGIVFSSDRNMGLQILKQKAGATGRDYIRLFYSKQLPDGTFDVAKPFSSKLNMKNKNTGYASFSELTSKVYFTRNSSFLNRKNTFNLQIYEAEASGSHRWKNVKVLPFAEGEANYMHPSISPDGTEIFFVAGRSRGKTGTDIYYAKKKNDTWGRAQRLPDVINTSANEGFPFMDKAGRLFFCSKGHPGYGGFDIFQSERDSMGNWSKPLNLGRPINSHFDDITFHLDSEKRKGAFTSSRGSSSDDIFLFYLPDSLGKFKTPVLPQSVKEEIVMKEESTDSISIDSFEIKKIETKPYRLFSELSTSDASFEIGESFVLTNVKYETDEYEVNEEIKPELRQLAEFLIQYPKAKIELAAFTECLGDEKNNQTLARYRAEGAAHFVSKQGVDPLRIIPVGYGEVNPLNECNCEVDCTWEELLINQRLEVKFQ